MRERFGKSGAAARLTRLARSAFSHLRYAGESALIAKIIFSRRPVKA